MNIINIIRIENGILDSIKSFVSNNDNEAEQFDKANAQYKAGILELDSSLSDEDVINYVYDGYFDHNGTEIRLVNSDEIIL